MISKFLKLLLTLLLLFHYNVNGQYGYYTDVLKFSHYFNGGSARIEGIGGATSSLGGDISSTSINPAGLGFFNKKVFSIGYKSMIKKNTSSYLGESSYFDSSFDKINNVSIVLPVRKRSGFTRDAVFECKDCPKFNIGISHNVLKDFRNERYYRGYNDNNSIIDYFLYDAQGIPLSQISNSQPISGIGLLQEAYDHYLINPSSDLPGSYFSFVGGYPLQEERVSNDGSLSKFSISAGLNFNDKFYMGLGSNIYFLNYRQTRFFQENNYEIINDNGEWEFEGILDYLILRDSFKITGNGSSLSFGMIFKPINELNIGFNYESKTKYLLNEEYDSELETSYFDYYFQPEDTVLGSSVSGTALNVAEYNFTSPSKFTIGASYFIKKNGFISVDVDFINYTSSSLQSSDFDTYRDNQEIRNIYKTLAVNYRFGVEGRFDNFYIRAGYNFLADPNRIKDIIDNGLIKKSLGIGYLVKSLNIDLSYSSINSKSNITPYPIYSNQPVAEFTTKHQVIKLTLGVRINNR